MGTAFEKGYTVFRRGVLDKLAKLKNLVANPFKSKTSSYREWERGFNSAYFEHLKKVQNNEHRYRSKTSGRDQAVLQPKKQTNKN